MKRTSVQASFLAFVLGCGTDEAPPDPPPPPDPTLPEGVTSFDGTDPALPGDDLATLWGLVGDARLIGLGEAVHTSGGFYAAKDRLIRNLIEEHGVRWFAMETPRLQTKPTADFVSAGVGCDTADQRAFMAGMFAVFASDRTAALVRFACTWNAQHPSDKVTFFGFDQQEPAEDRQALLDFLGGFAPADRQPIVDGVARCLAALTDQTVSDADHDACLAGLAAADAFVAAHGAADARDVRLARLAVASWRSYEDEAYFTGRDEKASFEARDREMAHVLDERLALDVPADARVVVWAHDYHLSAAPTPIGDSATQTTMGTALRAAHGAAYAPVAITAFRPGINWPGVGVGPTPLGTQAFALEASLHALGEPFLVVDPHAPFAATQQLRVGSLGPFTLADHYAAIVYLDSSPGMTAVYW